jgi:RNA polymerase sigma factor (sigma-70 family)
MPQPQSEVAFVLAAQAGDKAAFGHLIERYEAMAWRLAVRMVGSREIAHELTQEAMLQAYLSLARLNDVHAFGSWLYGIVLNVCRNYRRNQKVAVLSLEAMLGGLHFDALPFAGGEPSPYEVAELRELHAAVLAAVESLAPAYGEVTLLFYYDQLSLREIAALLGISVSAVKVRLHRSRAQLRELLAPLYQPFDEAVAVPERNTKMVKVTIADIVVNEETGNRIVVLYDEPGQRLLPIWIGPFEADAIALLLLGHAVPRPLTYEFTARLLEAAGATLEEVRVEAIKESTFYAVAKLRSGSTVHEVDARPSDAIALAVRSGCPIYATGEVMEKAGFAIPAEVETPPQRKGLDKIGERLAQMMQEHEQKLQESKEEEGRQTQAEDQEKRQKLIVYLFGGEE